MSNALNQKLVELEKNLRELSTLNEVSNSFKAILSLPQLFDPVPRGICERFGFERAVLYLVEDGTLRAVAASFGRDAEEQAKEFSPPPTPSRSRSIAIRLRLISCAADRR